MGRSAERGGVGEAAAGGEGFGGLGNRAGVDAEMVVELSHRARLAEVLDADAFSLFRNRGIFSSEAGAAFRNGVLAKGDSEDPERLFRDFMGRDPDPRALLVRLGLDA